MPDIIPVIDCWSPIVPSREIMHHVAHCFPEPMLGYLRVFGKRAMGLEEYRDVALKLAQTDQTILGLLDEAGIKKTLVTGFDEASSAGGRTFVANEPVAAFVERHPGRFIAFCGADVFRGADAVRDVERWIKERGFTGLSLRPFMIGEPATDRHYYPFYEKCVELDIPLSMHASANWTQSRPSELGHPRYFDQVACDFPDLKLILSHAGYPWVLEACLIAWKHPNVYLELAAHRPKYFTAPGAGWEPLIRYGQTTIQDKVLYGTGAFLLGARPAELVDEFQSLPVKREVMEKWCWKNAAQLFGIADVGIGSGGAVH